MLDYKHELEIDFWAKILIKVKKESDCEDKCPNEPCEEYDQAN